MALNPFKRALAEGRTQIGLWATLPDAYTAELLATTGFDWLLIDGEHAPNDLSRVLAQVQAMGAYPVHPIVRPVEGDVALIKQLLDIGVQTLLVPMVDTAEQAARMAAAMRYPPRGIRGLGSAVARASRWNSLVDYATTADAEMCLLVQAESVTALANLAEIAAVEGVDGVFFGPADLSASMGLLGQPLHPDVTAAISHGISTVRAAGKACGIIQTDPAEARRYLDLGATFVAVGVDSLLLRSAAKALATEFHTAR